MDINELTNELLRVLLKYRSLLICIKGSPDPDVIGSSYALSVICGKLGITYRISCAMRPSLPQNKAIIKNLNIPIYFEESVEDVRKYDAYAILDFQSAQINGISGIIPCAIHIDHHDPIEENIDIDYKQVIVEAGSVSTFFALVFKELNQNKMKFDKQALINVSTALLYGIQVDTDSYKHATHLDLEALNYISNYSDKKIIECITEIPLPGYVLRLIVRALKNKTEYKSWLIAGIGFIDESERDSIAIIADNFVEKFNCSLAVVFAIIEKKKPYGLKLDASFRTEDENINLNKLIHIISDSGGGRKFKGAYQVNLDYFAASPDKDLLWELVESTTVAKLKKIRDEAQLSKIKGFYSKIIYRAGKIFKSQ
ncbi:MAG: hypothetical protein JW864_03655 [Spirochaetes bacterium]|nr:hypothetical protein [Spirochaetota bacterium]